RSARFLFFRMSIEVALQEGGGGGGVNLFAPGASLFSGGDERRLRRLRRVTFVVEIDGQRRELAEDLGQTFGAAGLRAGMAFRIKREAKQNHFGVVLGGKRDNARGI